MENIFKSKEKYLGQIIKKQEVGVRDQPSGPIPGGAVTCTTSSINRILTKDEIFNQFNRNQSKIIAIFGHTHELTTLMEENLKGLGYRTLIPNFESENEFIFSLKKANAIAYSRREDASKFTDIKEAFPNIKEAKLGVDFMPEPIFKNKFLTLSEIKERNQPNKRK